MPATPERSIEDARMPSRANARQEIRREERLTRPSRNGHQDQGPLTIDKSRIPPGFVMEWKRHSIFGKEDRHNRVVAEQNHWKIVPHKLMPNVLGSFGDTDPEQPIIVKDLGLYMRPKYLNEDAMEELREETAYTLDQQIKSLRVNSEEQVGKRFTKIKQTMVPGQPVE